MADVSNRSRAAVVVGLLGVVLAVLAITRLAGGEDTGDGSNQLPTVDLTSSTGDTISTDTFRGTPMVINFWFSSCAPCANELRDFAAVHDEYGDEVRFIGVNPIDDTAAMVEFAAERDVTYELFQDRLADFQTAMRLTTFPTTLFVTADGEIVEQTGVLDESALTSEINDLLALG